jgi:hypothetical protein
MLSINAKNIVGRFPRPWWRTFAQVGTVSPKIFVLTVRWIWLLLFHLTTRYQESIALAIKSDRGPPILATRYAGIILVVHSARFGINIFTFCTNQMHYIKHINIKDTTPTCFGKDIYHPRKYGLPLLKLFLLSINTFKVVHSMHFGSMYSHVLTEEGTSLMKHEVASSIFRPTCIWDSPFGCYNKHTEQKRVRSCQRFQNFLHNSVAILDITCFNPSG